MTKISTPVYTERHSEHVVIVTLNRPDARNAVNAEMARAFENTVQEIESDRSVRAVVLTGAGDRAFCAGADLREVSNGGLDHLFTAAGGFAGFVNAPRRKPWLAAVNGFALAGGCEIALACDIVVAASNGQFGLPEVTRGLIASAGGLYRLPRAIPKGLAFEMIATGGPISAERAFSLGLCNHVYPLDRLLHEAVAIAETIAGNAPLAVEESLQLARAAAVVDDPALRLAGDEAQRRLSATADFKEGALAFVEKRPAEWAGR